MYITAAEFRGFVDQRKTLYAMYNYVTVCMSNFGLFFMLSTFQKRESVTMYQSCMPLVSILLRLARARATYFV